MSCMEYALICMLLAVGASERCTRLPDGSSVHWQSQRAQPAVRKGLRVVRVAHTLPIADLLCRHSQPDCSAAAMDTCSASASLPAATRPADAAECERGQTAAEREEQEQSAHVSDHAHSLAADMLYTHALEIIFAALGQWPWPMHATPHTVVACIALAHLPLRSAAFLPSSFTPLFAFCSASLPPESPPPHGPLRDGGSALMPLLSPVAIRVEMSVYVALIAACRRAR